jgi:predicted HAD superfamily phosphohydrolase
VIYVGDGSSDVHVMLHVNNHDGFTIAVSENKQLARIAKNTVLSENAFSIMVPILDQLLHWRTGDIRELFESCGLTLNGKRSKYHTLTSEPIMVSGQKSFSWATQ